MNEERSKLLYTPRINEIRTYGCIVADVKVSNEVRMTVYKYNSNYYHLLMKNGEIVYIDYTADIPKEIIIPKERKV